MHSDKNSITLVISFLIIEFVPGILNILVAYFQPGNTASFIKNFNEIGPEIRLQV